MWVWKGLGYDNIVELPSGALGALGRRCKSVQEGTPMWNQLSYAAKFRPEWSGYDPPPESVLVVRDEDGDSFEVHGGSASSPDGGGVASTQRFAPMDKLRLCIPAIVELQNPGPQTAESIHGGRYSSLGDAMSHLIQHGGGVFVWNVPMVSVCLRSDIVEECCYASSPPEWPYCITGAVLGASVEIAVILLTEHSPRRGSWMPGARGDDVMAEPPIDCQGFQLKLVQRGGPPLDELRRKLDGEPQHNVVEELERWALKMLASHPDTWTVLHVTKRQGTNLSDELAPVPGPPVLRVRRTGDVIVAVAAETEVALEPFELSYGEAHIGTLKRMLEDEMADVLGIAPERVMCGDFVPSSRMRGLAPKQRHLKVSSIGVRFALLHSELEEMRKPKDALRKAPLPRARPAFGQSGTLGGASGNATPANPKLSPSKLSPSKHKAVPGGRKANFDGVPMQSSFQFAIKDSLLNATVKLNNQGFGDSRHDFRKTGASLLQASFSAPTLSLPALSPNRPPSGHKDLPPDLLLRNLKSLLTDPKHPMRRSPEVFPMLSRIIGDVRLTTQLVVDCKVAENGSLADGLKAWMKRGALSKTDAESHADTRMKLTGMRNLVMKLYDGPGGDVLAQQRQLTGLSAKELLDEMEGAVSKPTDLRAALLMLLQHTNKDIEWCLRLRSHKAVERILSLARRFNNDKSVVSKGVGIIANLTRNDPGCVLRLLEMNLAPDFIMTLENYPMEAKIQLNGTQVLNRVYMKARELAAHGPRVVILGKNIAEVWTFKGLERVLSNMRLFGDDAAIQIECLTLLSTLGEVLFNNGMAREVFTQLEVLMRRHDGRADVLAKGVLIIARLGPSFLQHEHRGVFTIIEALGRHRSNTELQRVGLRALLSLAREEKALHRCRAGNSVSAVVLAMSAHSQDEQVLREGVRVLEKLCPRGLAKVVHLCGDLGAILPPVSWNEYTHGSEWESVLFDNEWSAQLLKNFREEIVVQTRRQRAAPMTIKAAAAASRGDFDDEEEEAVPPAAVPDGGGPIISGGRLASLKGYRKAGLREELDAADTLWATSALVNSMSEMRERDIRALESKGCDSEKLRPAGPTSEHLKRLAEAMHNGLNQHFSAQDGELLATILGHFCWCSQGLAKEIMGNGGASALVSWLRSARFKGRSPEESELAYPMQRACLNALSSMCHQDEESAREVMSLGGAQLALDYSSHVSPMMQRAAMRLLTRLIIISKDRPPSDQVPREQAWDFVLRELRGCDEISRTCAAAAALEVVEGGWILDQEEEPPRAAAAAKSPELMAHVEELAVSLLFALNRAVESGTASAGLPLMLAVGRMLQEVEDEGRAAKLLLSRQGQRGQPNEKCGQSLVQLLAFWLPKGVATGAVAADKGASVAAALALQSLSNFEAPLPFREMRELLVCGQSTRAEPALREACKNALLLSVNSETQPQQLAYLFATSVGKVPGGEDRLAEVKILRSIAERIVQLLAQGQGQATDRLMSDLSKAEKLLPKDTQDDDTNAVVSLLAEARSFSLMSLNLAIDDEEARVEEESERARLAGTLSLDERPLDSPMGAPTTNLGKTSPPGLLAAAVR